MNLKFIKNGNSSVSFGMKDDSIPLQYFPILNCAVPFSATIKSWPVIHEVVKKLLP